MKKVINLKGLDKEKVLSPKEMKNLKGLDGGSFSDYCTAGEPCGWGTCYPQGWWNGVFIGCACR